MRFKTKSLSTWMLAAGIGCVWLFPSYALSQTPYYQGKTITMIRGGEPGGTGDMQAKALIPYLKKIFQESRPSSLRIWPARGKEGSEFIFFNRQTRRAHDRRRGRGLGRRPHPQPSGNEI